MNPVVEITSRSDSALEFVVRHIDLALANAVRRTILAEIENVAVVYENVLVSVNTCPLHDDIIAKRIALVPIKLSAAEVDAFVPSSLTLELHVKNDTKLPLDVTTEQIDLLLHGKPYPDKATVLPACPITGDYILITRLQPEQEIKLSAVATKGIADIHTSYAVTSIASYGYERDEEAIATARAALVTSLKEQDEADARNMLNRFDTIDSQRIYAREEDGSPVGYKFVMESESGLTCEEIVNRSFKILLDKFADPSFEHAFVRGDATFVRYRIYGEGYTLGGMLQSTAVDHADDLDIISAGFHQPHPLESLILLDVKCTSAIPDAVALMEAICELCTKRVLLLKDAFANV